ncbi:MAG: biotin/lipoyl-binding protein, partial [Victivallales bacterium]|nr:biotin/lipoyl-binding protein [Victivallales bacterium]
MNKKTEKKIEEKGKPENIENNKSVIEAVHAFVSKNFKDKETALATIRKFMKDNFKDRETALATIRKFMRENFKTKKAEMMAIRTALCVGVLVFALLVYGLFALLRQSPKARPTSELTKVLRAIPVKLGDIKINLFGYGTVEPIQEVTLSSELRGRITMKNIDLKEGQLVKKGQILAKIDTVDYVIALRKAMAEVAQLRGELAQINQYIKDWTAEIEKERKILLLCISDYKR